MYRYSLFDDEDQKQLDDDASQLAVLQQLIGGDNTPAPDTQLKQPAMIDDPPDDGSDPEIAPQAGALAARDETSTTRAPTAQLGIDKDINNKDFTLPGDRGDAPISQSRVSDGKDGGFAGMDWGTLGALVLDLGANRGRGVGQLVGAYAANKAADERAKQSHQDRLDEIAMRSGDPSYKLAQLQLAKQREADAQQRLGLTAKDLDRKTANTQHTNEQREDVDSATHTAAVEQKKRLSAAGVEGRENQRTEMLPQIEATEAGITGARTTAGTESKNATPADITPAEQARLDLQAQQLEESKRGRAVAEGQRADNEKQRQLNDFNKQYGGAMETLTAAQTLERLIGDHGDIEGVGPIVGSRFMPDMLKSDKAIEEQQALAAFRNPGFKARAGQAVTATEQPRLEAEFGSLTSSNPETVHNAVRAIAETMRNSIKRGAVGREELAREVLSSQHLDDVLGPAVIEDAPQSARDAMPQTRDAADLGVTQSTTRGAKNAGFAGPGVETKVKLKLPSGRIMNASLTEEQLAAAIAGGAELQ